MEVVGQPSMTSDAVGVDERVAVDGVKGRVVRSARSGDVVTIAVSVDEADGTSVEYEVALPLDRLSRLSADEQRREMAEAVRFERDRQRSYARVDLSALSGEIQVVPADRSAKEV